MSQEEEKMLTNFKTMLQAAGKKIETIMLSFVPTKLEKFCCKIISIFHVYTTHVQTLQMQIPPVTATTTT